MGKNKNKKNEKPSRLDAPAHAVALYSFSPSDDQIKIPERNKYTYPDISVQLKFSRGDQLEVISKKLDWWLICRHVSTGNEGYVPSVLLAPLVNYQANQGDDIDSPDFAKVSFIPCVDREYFDLKYFPNAPESIEKKPCPRTKANIFSMITFWWINSLIVTGYKRPLVEEDIWELEEGSRTNTVVKKCEQEWHKELEKWNKSSIIEDKKRRGKGKKPTDQREEDNLIEDDGSNDKSKEKNMDDVSKHKYEPSFSKMLFRVFGGKYLFGTMHKVFHDIIMFVSPFLLGKLINFVKSKNEDLTWGYIYAALLLVSVTAQSIELHQYFQNTFECSMRVRSAVIAMVYKKMLTLSNKGRRNYTAGEMVNMMSVDSQKCHDFVMYAAWFWSAPLQITVSLVFLYNLMGWSVFIGFLVLTLLIPINVFLSKKEKVFHSKQMSLKDTRSKIMNEILGGIKIMKLYSWEDSFTTKVIGYRSNELKQIRNSMILNSLVFISNSMAPFLVSIVTFASYVYLAKEELTAEKAFVAISLYSIVRFPLIFIPRLIQFYIQYQVSVKRITKFLKADELSEEDVRRLPSDDAQDSAVKIEGGNFAWDERETVLKDINLDIKKGSLTAIVGQVGTGKSSLLSAILGEIHKVDGDVTTSGKIAYVSQQAWIQNQSLRQNILFTKKFKQDKYDQTIKACALEADLDILPVRDFTEIGERGINLSGGQKQRVSLARAVYNNADIYLMDDPMSAVDAHVGKHIFEEVVGDNGMLKNKTRVLVTHNLTFLPNVDQIIVLKNNTISECGTYKELLENGGDFAEFLKTYHTTQEEEKEETVTEENNDVPAVSLLCDGDNERNSGGGLDNRNLLISASCYSLFDPVHEGTNEDTEIQELLLEAEQEEIKEANKTATIYQEEKSETGTVNRAVFFKYFRAMGNVTTILIFVFGFLQEALQIATRVWLADWSSHENITASERDHYVLVYGVIGISQSIAIMILMLCLAVGTIRSAGSLHNSLLKNILRCPMSFFETTPMGRIVNRFVKDTNVIDENIPKSFQSFITTFVGLFGTIFVISYSTPIFLAVLAPIAALYFFTQRFYVASSRQLKRIESVNRSPIYNHYFESIGGASTIRAFGKTDAFIEENEKRIDLNQGAHFPSISSNRWLALRLEFCGNLITFFAALFAIVNHDSITAGIAGLSISYALHITQSLNWLVRMTSELETNIVSVERVKNYIDAPTEAALEIPDKKPKDEWPGEGSVIFDSYSVRYREGLELVLKDLECNIKPREKIGIVGRTGAGKSSMMLALFRIIEASGGRILIDDVDISEIGLKDLRKKLSIIPQDPVLFSGTLRFNLDPFDTYADEEIWRALEVSHLKPFVSSLSDGLNHEITEGGDNLSVGQRQLICLARALLRKSKILVLDEATAAVDMETDSYIQHAIRNEFSSCTVLTIAHRLNTILDYDRILVLDKGHIAEFDAPDDLLADKNSIFYGMVKKAGVLNYTGNEDATD